MAITTRLFGRTGPSVTRVGLGGEGVLRTYGRGKEALKLIEEAAASGINYFDSAKAYSGSQGYYGSFWRGHQEIRSSIFQTSKSAARRYHEAQSDLRETLEVMGQKSLDLWQIHDLRTRPEIRECEGPNGALRAFLEAKEAGLVRRIGVTGHHDPAVLAEAVERWPVDTVLLPVNPVEAVLGGFVDRVLPVALDAGVAPLAMKVLGRGQYVAPDGGITAGVLVRFALTYPVVLAVVGCETPDQVAGLVRAAAAGPLEDEDARALVEAFRPAARRLAFYRGVL